MTGFYDQERFGNHEESKTFHTKLNPRHNYKVCPHYETQIQEDQWRFAHICCLKWDLIDLIDLEYIRILHDKVEDLKIQEI